MIDIFNHFMPKNVFERVRDLVPDHPAMKAFPELPTLWDVEARLKMMGTRSAFRGSSPRCP